MNRHHWNATIKGMERPNTNRLFQLGNRYKERAIKKEQVLRNL